LNYTPQKSDGSIDISEALQVNTEFDLSRQFWAYLVKKGAIKDPQSFIHSVPHFSFVRGAENVAFLKRRFEALSAHPNYRGMEYSDDKTQIEKWTPLVMEGRDPTEQVAATRMVTGTDVDFGALTMHDSGAGAACAQRHDGPRCCAHTSRRLPSALRGPNNSGDLGRIAPRTESSQRFLAGG
jgi:L-2-hydroxyglutarate oxidase LhgO